MEASATCDCSRADYAEEGPTAGRTEIRKAKKQHECCECDVPIMPGDEYEYTTGCWEGTWSVYKTCKSCAWIRHRYCSAGYAYGNLLEQIEECTR